MPVKPLPTIDVKPTMCTGCEICVKVCPQDVLEMVAAPFKVEGALAAVKDIDKCTTCMLCEVNCPHFAIFVEPGKAELTTQEPGKAELTTQEPGKPAA